MTGPAPCLSALLGDLASVPPQWDRPVWGVESDSRRVRPGDLFLATRGQTRHGLEFLDQALDQGAGAVAWEPEGLRRAQANVPTVAVADLQRHAGEIAARFYGEPSATLAVTGITGTDGKTSVAHITAQALAAAGRPCGYLGTLGSGIPGALRAGSRTTPDAVTVQRWLARFVADGLGAAALEVSSHALDQWRVAGVRFRVAVLTHISRDHLDYHGTLENYVAAKRRLFELPGVGAAVLNADDEYGREWIGAFGGRMETVAYGSADGSRNAGADHFVAVVAVESRADGLRVTLESDWGRGVIDSPLLGRFNAWNLAAAAAVLMLQGVDWSNALLALAGARTVPGRMEGFGSAGQALAVVDYAHTPDALAQALGALRPHCEGRLWCVFGCGGNRDRGKRSLMGAAAAAGADRIIVTDDNPRDEKPSDIVRDILAGVPDTAPVQVIHDRGEAIARALSRAQPGDVVLIAGKGHETEQVVGSQQRAFSDRRFVAERQGLELTV